MPISSSASFTGYTAGGFGEEEQIALKEQCDMLNAKGIKFLLSNSSCEFIEDLYKDYIIDYVDAKQRDQRETGEARGDSGSSGTQL